MPGHSLRFILDEFGENRSARRRRRKTPPYPRLLGGRRKLVVSVHQMGRMPEGIGTCGRPLRWNGAVVAYGYNEQPWPRLRHETHGVHYHSAKPIVIRQGRANRRKIFSVMRGQRAADILQHDERWPPALLLQCLHEAPERPEGSGARAFQS